METDATTPMIEATSEMLGESLKVSKDAAYLLIQFGEKLGWIKKIGNMPPKGNGKGRGSTIYGIPTNLIDRIAQIWETRQPINS
jgi:hypothetical protein